MYAHCSVSTLLTLAERDDDPKDKGHDFAKVLIDEIRRLRKQLDEDENQVLGSTSKLRKGFRPQPPQSARFGTSGHRAHFNLDNDAVRAAVQRPTLLTEPYLRNEVPRFSSTAEQMNKMGVEQQRDRGAGSHCVFMKIGPDGTEESITRDEVPSHILAQMQADGEN